MPTLTKTPWKIIGRGFAGWHASAHNVTSSGGDINPYTYWTGEQCDGYAQEAEEGCPVYDVRDCEMDPHASELFDKLTISGPMVNVDLSDEGADAYVDRRALEYIPVNEYMRRVSLIPGCKVGYVKNGQVVWTQEG
ncbi:MAG: hypothetical protein D4R44_06915 [Actinobacteria bacterium]|nr:MAG: hypothetical protein D4R44_06915 [Actinomycetota bacterium]